MSTYNPAIPVPTDLLSNSQPQILGNFIELNSQFGVDHSPYNTGSGNGNGHHLKVTYDAPIATPAPGGTTAIEYTKTVTGETELEYTNATHNTQITSGGLPIWKGGTIAGTGVVNFSATDPGNITFPNGLVMQWGSSTVTDNAVVPFQVAFPTGVLSLTISGVRADVQPRVLWVKTGSITTTQFQVRTDSVGGMLIYFCAIGH